MTRLALILAHEAIRRAAWRAMCAVATRAGIPTEARADVIIAQWYSTDGDSVAVWPRGRRDLGEHWPVARCFDSIERGEVFTVMSYVHPEHGDARVVVTLTRDEIAAPDKEREEEWLPCDE